MTNGVADTLCKMATEGQNLNPLFTGRHIAQTAIFSNHS